ncbi:MAG TPA: hypothetical protein VEY09_15755 [Pyrinomonadaceae bacterium]|nr:hypothetical protein [Pyrinomonadaceae bacterium]
MRVNVNNFARLCLAVLLVLGCARAGAARDGGADEAQRAFFDNLKKLCGQKFEGSTAFPTDDPGHPMAGKRLVMHVETCREGEVRIPFRVGEDRSRTWVLTMTDAGLLFKHDHRHDDGTPDKVTDYGGHARPGGTPDEQHFPADEQTRKLIPEAATNVWTLRLDPAKRQFVYYLERHGRPRYRAVFDLGRPL